MTNTVKRRDTARKEKRSPKLLVASVLILSVIVSTIWGISALFTKLENIWHEQCTLKNAELDVSITEGRMVLPEIIIMHFGLTNGANLAQIDYADLREKLLKKVPNIQDIKITRLFPDRVTVNVIEREPIARVAGTNRREFSTRVTDAEGVVFKFSRDTASLPIIRDASIPPVKPGDRLKGQAAAALELICKCAMVSEFGKLQILEIDTSSQDYVTATLGDYSRAKIAWYKMGEKCHASNESLTNMLTKLSQAVATGYAAGTPLWNATNYRQNRVYAVDPTKLERNAIR